LFENSILRINMHKTVKLLEDPSRKLGVLPGTIQKHIFFGKVKFTDNSDDSDYSKTKNYIFYSVIR